MENLNASRWKLTGIIAAFALPLLVAWLAYHQSWSFSSAPASHGTLLLPVKPLPEFVSSETGGMSFSKADLRGKWWLFVVSDGTCNLHCEADLFKSRQVRLALGRDRARLKSAYIKNQSEPHDPHNAGMAKTPRNTPQLTTLIAPSELLAILPEPGIYLIDPNGNLVMYYSRLSTSKGIRKDLKHLLKVSRIG